MTGMMMDAVLIVLLIAAVGYGMKLERKLKTLREGQVAFAQAVSELNTAAGRAETALATLRASGQETDLLHDRILKAREVKAQLEHLIARGPATVSRREDDPVALGPTRSPQPQTLAALKAETDEDDDRARRMSALADRIQGLAGPGTDRRAPSTGRQNVEAIVQALTAGRVANQTAKQNLNAARRNLDEDLFAA